jgi:hypothetical protein
MSAIGSTDNFYLTTGRPIVPRIADENLRRIDELLAQAMAYPYVPNLLSGAEGKTVGVHIKTLEVGAGLVLRDQGDGCFIIELAPTKVEVTTMADTDGQRHFAAAVKEAQDANSAK